MSLVSGENSSLSKHTISKSVVTDLKAWALLSVTICLKSGKRLVQFILLTSLSVDSYLTLSVTMLSATKKQVNGKCPRLLNQRSVCYPHQNNLIIPYAMMKLAHG